MGSPILLNSTKEKRLATYVVTFLSSGSVTNPENGKYHLEIASYYEEHASDLQYLLEILISEVR
jgi:DNA-binding protein WhiA